MACMFFKFFQDRVTGISLLMQNNYLATSSSFEDPHCFMERCASVTMNDEDWTVNPGSRVRYAPIVRKRYLSNELAGAFRGFRRQKPQQLLQDLFILIP